MKRIVQKAFTLVELLIVIGIIGILAVVLLVTLNPAEAQRKARDAKRIKDASTLQVVMEQAVSDSLIANGDPITLTAGVNSGADPVADRKSQDVCEATNWLKINICNYAKSAPMDPLNGYSTTVANEASAVYPTYRVRVSGIDYEINVRQESAGNAKKLSGDTSALGASSKWFEIASGPFNLFGD